MWNFKQSIIIKNDLSLQEIFEYENIETSEYL